MSTSNSPPWESQAETSAKIDLLRRDVRAAWSTPARTSVPVWADTYRKLAKGFGAMSGNWETSYVEIARGPMLSVTEPGVRMITTMVCTQLLKTEFLLNVFGFFAHTDPCPILMLQPKDEAALQFSKERLQPMIAATPELRERIGGSEETLTYKPFAGGFCGITGAGSPDNVARRPVRIVLADEIDKYRPTKEGSTLDLVGERTATFGLNSLEVRACSPTIEDESAIDQSYGLSDQRRASLACPHCEHRLFPDFFKHVQWDKDEEGHHLPKTARIYCEACGAGWSEGERLKALQTARWHQTRPFDCCGQRHVPMDAYAKAWGASGDSAAAAAEVWDWWDDEDEGRYAVYRARCPDCGEWPVDNTHAGFQAGKLYSPSQKDKPSDQARKWLEAKGDADRELVWWNTQQGLPHRPNAGKPLPLDAMVARAEVWPAPVPDGVAVLTMGIDVQDYRVELETVGWGMNEESWSVDYHVIDGQFSEPSVQSAVDEHLKRVWRRNDGRGFEVMAACIDSGGHHTQAVYAFAKARLARRVWAVKGESARMGQRSPVWPTKRPSSRNKQSFRPVIIGVNAAKDTIWQRLRIEKPGAGYMHFPVDRDIGYYSQLTAERTVVKVTSGIKYRVWELIKGRANEALDCRVYAYAALCGALHFGLALNRKVEAMNKPPLPEEFIPAPDEVEAEPVPDEVRRISLRAQTPAPVKRSFVSRLA